MLEKPRGWRKLHLHKAAVWPLRKRNRARAKKSRPTPNTHTRGTERHTAGKQGSLLAQYGSTEGWKLERKYWNKTAWACGDWRERMAATGR